MGKNDKQYLLDLMNEMIAAETQVALIFWSVLGPDQRLEFEGKLKAVIAQDDARLPQPAHRTGILKALLRNLEATAARQQPSASVSHLRAVPGALHPEEARPDKK